MTPSFRPRLKPISAQVIVITGATSGIGLATARLAAAQGAAVVLAARNEPALQNLAAEIRAAGGRAEAVVADVSDPVQVHSIAARADAAFGGFDTWINDAAVTIYGRIEETPLEDQRRLFDATYWGMVHGSLTAVQHLRAREGGALINVGSILSDVAVPIQGVYSAAKHAVKGFTNALRLELMRDAPHVSVTLIKPSAIDTPYKLHARNYTGHPASTPPPVYDPAIVAEAILHAAQTPTREITVGGAGRLLAMFSQLAPVIADPLMAWVLPLLSRERRPQGGEEADNLFRPARDGQERAGGFPLVRRTSLYTRAQLNPTTTALALLGAAVAGVAALAARDQLRLAQARRTGRRQERARHARRQGHRGT